MSLPFPNVPNVPGVPPVPRLPGNVPALVNLVTPGLSGTLWQASQAPAVWGVFKFTEVDDINDPNYPGTFDQVIFPDTIIDFSDSNDWNTSNFPIQGGKFSTYNKVKLPPENSLRFRKTGTASDRKAFLGQIEAIAGDTELYTIVTPEWTYTDLNITRFGNVRHGSEAAYALVEVDVFFVNVPAVSAQYSSTQTNVTNAQDPATQPVTNQGAVNPQPTDAQTEAIAESAL